MQQIYPWHGMHFVRRSCRLLTLFLFLLGSGTVFGQSESDLNFSDSTAYEPTVSSDKTDYLPGQVATITGSGWTLDDSVHVEFIETPDYPDFHVYDLAVGADGSWEILYDIEQRHYGVQFTVVAIGKSSGKVATTVFWDGPTISSIDPNLGPVSGGNIVKINLSDFTGPALPTSSNVTVTFGGTSGTNITPIASGFNPYSIDAVFVRTPARPRGSVNVVVTYTYQTTGKNGNVTTTNVSATSTNGYAYDTRPSVLNVAKTGSEDTDLTCTAANFTGSYSDADGDALNKIQVLSLPANGTLKLGNKAVTVGQEIPLSSLSNLVFEPAGNYNGFTSFQWNGSDGLAYAENPAFVNINLAPVNDAPTVSAFTKSGLEDTEIVFAAPDFSPAFNDIDGDPLNRIRVTSLPAAGAGVLKLNGVNVTLNQIIQASDLSNLVFVPTANFNGSASFGWKGFDAALESAAAATVTLSITAVNDAPSFVKGADQTVLEDAGARTVSGWATSLSKGPADEAGQTLTFMVSNNNNGLFSAQPAVAANGTLTFTPAANANGSATVTVFVKDNGGTANGGEDTSPSQTFTINVTPVNDAPSFIKGANVTVLEDAPVHTVTAWTTTFSTGPADESEQSIIGFIVTNNNNALFSVQPAIAADGTLTFTPAPDAVGNATVSVRAQDNGGTANGGVDTSPIQTFTITVTPVNDAPSFVKGADQMVLEDAGARTVSGWATSLSKGPADEAGQTLAFTVSNDNNALFSVQPAVAANGTLTFTPAANANGSATVTVFVKDNGGTANGGEDTSPSQTFTINVTPVNDAPTFVKGANQTVPEDAGSQTVVAWAKSISTGPADEANQAIIGFTVTNNNNALFSVQPAIAPDGTLTYTSAADAFGSATVSVTLKDNGGTANGGVDTSPAQTFTITVTPVNDAPVVATSIANVTVNEDAANTMIDLAGTFTDVDNATLTLSVSGNSNPGLVNATYNASTGRLRLMYGANQYGEANITIKATDADGLFAETTFLVTVIPVNDAPTFTKGANQTVLEDAAPQTVAGWATAISTGPANEASQTLSFTASNDNNALFSVQPAVSPTGVLTYTVSPNANGSATVEVFVTDNGGTDDGGADTSPSQTFTISVTPVNDAPTFTLAASAPVILEDAGAQSVAQLATDIDDGDTELSQALTFHITGNSNPALFAVAPALSATGELTYTPAADANGSATIKVRLSDDGSGIAPDVNTSVEKTFTITVNPVNDAPAFVKGTDQTVLEDAAAQTIAGWATAISTGPANESAQSIVGFTVVNDNNDLFSVQPAVAANGTLTFTPALNANGSATVTVYVKDNGGTANGGVDVSTTQSFTITVTPVNDAPSFAKGANQTVLEDAAPQTVANWATAISTGPANESDQSIVCFTVSNDNNGLFSVQPAVAVNGTLTYTLAPDANGSATVTVYVKDNGGTTNGGVDRSPAQTFTITVTPVNDAPSFVKGANQTVLEDAASQTVAGWATAISTGPANEASQSIVGFTVSNNNNGLFSVQPAIAVNGTLSYKPAANANGSATVTVYVKDNGGTANGGVDTSPSQTFTINVTPVNDPPVVINNRSAQTVKYSEVIAAVAVSASDIDNAFSDLTASTAWKKSTDVSFTSGLPQALSLTLGAGSGNTRSWSLAGNMNVAPGDYVVRVTVSDNTNDSNATGNTGYTDIAFTVVREDAKVVYSGLEYFATATSTSAIANVEYMATISDEDVTGDVTSSQLLFKDDILNSFLKNVTLVNPANTTIGGGRTGVFNVTLSGQEMNAGGKTYNLNVSAEGNYQGTLAEPVLITVAVPGQDFVNGGGHQVMTQSSGKYAATAASKMNYGFTMKWNSSGKNIQGQANIIFRRWINGQWRTYQIKSNAINTLGTSTITGGRRADFNTKANLTDVTNPLAPLSLGGGLDLSVQAFESTVNGVKDQFSVTLRSGNELWFSSYWDGAKSLMRDVNGGAIKVRNANTPIARVMTEPAQTVQPALELIAYPSPFNEKFTLRLNQPLTSDAKVAVYNLFGTSAFDGTLKAGEKSIEIDLVHQTIGVYLVQVQAGEFNQIIKVIKSEPVR